MGAGASGCKAFDLVSDADIKAAVESINLWEDQQKAGQRAQQALKTVRKDSFKKAAKDLHHAGSLVERIGGPDRVHDVVQAFYRKLFANPEVRHYFESLPPDRMRAKQMKFMRYIMGGPRTYFGNLRGVHVGMVTEGGLDLPRFNTVVGLLGETMAEMGVPQDVVDEILSHVDSARHAIFTPNADEMVSKEEMVGAAAELEQQNPLIKKLGGPEAVQQIVQAFYKRLFGCDQLRYFFVNMSRERLRNMQFKFMRYLFCGASSYAQTGGNMRCVHARLVREGGLDVVKFDMVAQMLQDVLDQQMVAKAHVNEVLANVAAAKQAIFTPGPDELVTREEMVSEAARLPADVVQRLGGPDGCYELMRVFYSRLFNDEQLKYFFALSAERLRTKQFRFLHYLVGGPEAYATMMVPAGDQQQQQQQQPGAGGLRCRHLAMIRDKGLDEAKFERVVDILRDVMAGLGLGKDVVSELLVNVAAAKQAIFTPGPDELLEAAAAATDTSSPQPSLYARLGGDPIIGAAVDILYGKIQGDAQLSYILAGADMAAQRAQQLAFLRQALSADGGGGSSVFSVAAAHLKRDKGVSPEHASAVNAHALAGLELLHVPPAAAAELAEALGAAGGGCFLCPVGSAATGCPFASMFAPASGADGASGGELEDELDALIASATESFVIPPSAAAAAASSSKPATPASGAPGVPLRASAALVPAAAAAGGRRTPSGRPGSSQLVLQAGGSRVASARLQQGPITMSTGGGKAGGGGDEQMMRLLLDHDASDYHVSDHHVAAPPAAMATAAVQA